MTHKWCCQNGGVSIVFIDQMLCQNVRLEIHALGRTAYQCIHVDVPDILIRRQILNHAVQCTSPGQAYFHIIMDKLFKIRSRFGTNLSGKCIGIGSGAVYQFDILQSETLAELFL